jgi:hypothetical protein
MGDVFGCLLHVGSELESKIWMLACCCCCMAWEEEKEVEMMLIFCFPCLHVKNEWVA